MSSVSFGSLNNNNNNVHYRNNDKKAKIKKAVIAAAAIGTAVIGGVALYRNRNSKPVKSVTSFIGNKVISPFKQKGVPLKEKFQNVFNNIKDSLHNLKHKKTPKTQGADTFTPLALTEGKQKAPAKKELLALPAPSMETLALESFIKSKNKAGALFEAAKDQAVKLRTAAAALGAGVAAGVGASAVISKAGSIQEEKFVKDKQLAIIHNGEEFKGAFIDGIAYDEDCEPLNGKLIVVFNRGFDPENPDKEPSRSDISKAMITYKNGRLKQSTLFESLEDKVPKTIKSYDPNTGKLTKKYDDIVPDKNKKGAIKANRISTYELYEGRTPVLGLEQIVTGDGTGKTKRYSANVNSEGKITGAPVYETVNRTEKKPDGTIVSTWLIPDSEGIDTKVSMLEKKPDGKMDITLLTSSFNLTKNETPVLRLSLDENGAPELCSLLAEDDEKKNGLVSIKGGRVFGISCAKEKGTLRKLDEKAGEEELYALRAGFGDLKLGISRYPDNMIKTISAYYNEKEIPDCRFEFQRTDENSKDIKIKAYVQRNEVPVFML